MAQPDLGLGYFVSDGSTLSEDDSPQQNDAGAIVRGLSGTCGGPEDGIAPENSGGIVILSQASEGAMSKASAGLQLLVCKPQAVSALRTGVCASLARFGRPTRSNRSCPNSLARCHGCLHCQANR
eukprot:360213-Chlamydomonas_euryale.AAC.4